MFKGSAPVVTDADREWALALRPAHWNARTDGSFADYVADQAERFEWHYGDLRKDYAEWSKLWRAWLPKSKKLVDVQARQFGGQQTTHPFVRKAEHPALFAEALADGSPQERALWSKIGTVQFAPDDPRGDIIRRAGLRHATTGGSIKSSPVEFPKVNPDGSPMVYPFIRRESDPAAFARVLGAIEDEAERKLFERIGVIQFAPGDPRRALLRGHAEPDSVAGRASARAEPTAESKARVAELAEKSIIKLRAPGKCPAPVPNESPSEYAPLVDGPTADAKVRVAEAARAVIESLRGSR